MQKENKWAFIAHFYPGDFEIIRPHGFPCCAVRQLAAIRQLVLYSEKFRTGKFLANDKLTCQAHFPLTGLVDD